MKMTNYSTVFENKGITFYNFKGKPCVIAKELGKLMEYGSDGSGLPDVLANRPEYVRGHDFDVLTGSELREFKALSDVTGCEPVSDRAHHLTILYESGFDLACLRTEKPVGLRLRRFLVDEVLPKLRRGETVGESPESTMGASQFKYFLELKAHVAMLVTFGKISEDAGVDHVTALLERFTGVNLRTAPSDRYNITPAAVPVAALPANTEVRTAQETTGYHSLGTWYFQPSGAELTHEEKRLGSEMRALLENYVAAQGRKLKPRSIKDEAAKVLRTLKWHPLSSKNYEVTDEVRAQSAKYSLVVVKTGLVSSNNATSRTSPVHTVSFNRSAITGVINWLTTAIPVEAAKRAAEQDARRAREAQKAARKAARKQPTDEVTQLVLNGLSN